ncbi:MAG: 50S ribosomal protein L9 [Candidatus Pelagibacter sp.]|tara:strand:- start:1460 stop:1918 length:459 start_codon:yes stop_codon:yes gene_type:complete
MKVVLLENVRKVGSIGEIIDVKRGFARNYLISKKKALFASKENIKQVEKIKQELSKKDNEKKKDAKNIQEKIQNKEFKVKKLSTENKELYGSVKPTEISKIISESVNIKINPSLIQPIKEIKSLGTFKIILSLHSEIQAQVILKVESEETAK